jgi:hypothetical protein
LKNESIDRPSIYPRKKSKGYMHKEGQKEAGSGMQEGIMPARKCK